MATKVSDERSRLAAAMMLYQIEELSAGEAAEHAGISMAEFLRQRGAFGVLAIKDRSDEELERELQVARDAAGGSSPTSE